MNGKEIESRSNPAKVTCPNCAEDNPVTVGRCVWCGQSLPDTASKSQPRQSEYLVPRPAQAQPLYVHSIDDTGGRQAGVDQPSLHKRAPRWLMMTLIGIFLVTLAVTISLAVGRSTQASIATPDDGISARATLINGTAGSSDAGHDKSLAEYQLVIQVTDLAQGSTLKVDPSDFTLELDSGPALTGFCWLNSPNDNFCKIGPTTLSYGEHILVQYMDTLSYDIVQNLSAVSWKTSKGTRKISIQPAK